MKRVQIDNNIVFRPSSKDDLKEFVDFKNQYTATSYSVCYNNEVVCIAGIERRKGYFFMFMSEIKNINVSAFYIVKAARKFIDFLVEDVGVDIYALPSENKEKAKRFLGLLGFRPYTHEVLVLKRGLS